MKKDTAGFSQFTDSVACRVYTLPRNDGSLQPKGWIQGNTKNGKNGPVLEVATCFLHRKYGVDIRIMYMNNDDFLSWVRTSYGSNKFVMNLNNNEQEIPEVQLEDCALKFDANDFASRSEAKAKPQTREFASFSTKTLLIGKRIWTDVEPGEYSISDYSVLNKLIFFSLWKFSERRRWNDWILENQRRSLQKYFPHCHHSSDNKWKKSMAWRRGTKQR